MFLLGWLNVVILIFIIGINIYRMVYEPLENERLNSLMILAAVTPILIYIIMTLINF